MIDTVWSPGRNLSSTMGESIRQDPARWNARTRRDVLAGGLAGAAGALLAACSGETVRHAVATKPAGSDIGAIDHIVFLMMENRSFDHYFGSYPGVRGFGDRAASGVFDQAWAAAPASNAGRLLPFHLDIAQTNASCTFDLSHEWAAQHAAWNNGAMDRWVATHTLPQYEGPDHGPLTMGHYTRADLPFHYALADAFTLCDGYHCSVLGPTHPNRLFALSGTIDPAGEAGGPVVATQEGPGIQYSASWETMPERLQTKGVSWKVYNPAGPTYQPDSPLVMEFSDNILLYFKQYSEPASQLHQLAFTPTFPDTFTADVASGELPQVSWIVPPIGFDEHPPAPPQLGAWYMHQVIQTLISNPKVWAKTALFIMYDENDGFFDHVAPPTPPAGTPDEFLTAARLPEAAAGIRGPIGLGMRVPMLVVSPFSRGGYISSEVFDHTSQMRLIEERFGVQAPGISAWRRKTTGDLTSTLGAVATTTLPGLPATSRTDPVIATQCTTLQTTLEVNSPTPSYPIPATQQQPTQERGRAKRRSTNA